jgi:hypothetical protein
LGACANKKRGNRLGGFEVMAKARGSIATKCA